MVKIEEVSSSSTHPWEYHVFLSFRGEDTRYNFTGHLCAALRQKGIKTFMDDELRRGETIKTALVQAIERSRISIIVFSKNYASSKWCLDELVTILECKQSKQQMVRPIFYKVDPSDVRHHGGTFGEALADHEFNLTNNSEKVQKWKAALTEAANLSGWHLLDEHHSEPKLIGEIVEEISKQVIERTYLEVAKYPVGIEPRVQYVKELLSVEGREEVRMVGIWGTGGIGKTTIAKAVYNSISHNFDGSCFMENVRENSTRNSRGLAKLQQTLLFEILGGPKLKLTNASQGMTMIKERLRCKRVLLVLDDVNHPDQLNSLARESDWFGTGSRIIITTRDKKLLTVHNVNLIYKVNELDDHEALELFCRNAFKRNEPLEDYVELTKRAIVYARGLPLALTVIGSHLYGVNLNTWKDTLDGFKSLEIQEILKVSYDALAVLVKQVFLDIACFFKGERTDYVIQALEGCDLPKYGIDVLVEKALINIDHGCIWMHDLLEELGKDIVHQESPDIPGERSRLWFHEDVYHVLTENTGTSKITGIKVELPKDLDVIILSGTTFSQMRNLRVFIYRSGCISGVLGYLPNNLRVVDWPDCPFKSLPPNFNPRKLAVLSMPECRITGILEGFKVVDRDTFEWHIKLPSLRRWEVPKWFYYRKVDVCELLIEIPRSLMWGRIGLVVCVIFEIIPAPCLPCGISMDVNVMMDEIHIAHSVYEYFGELSGYHAWLKYIGLDNHWKQHVDKKSDQSLSHIFRVLTYMNRESDCKPMVVKSCGLHLDNMPGNDDGDEHMLGNDDDTVAEEDEDEEVANYDVDDDDARGEDLAKKTKCNIGRATLAFLRCFGITCL